MKSCDKNITVFYDGQCPLCNWEINHLKKLDTQQNIQFENIHNASFSNRHPQLNPQQLDALLHVQTSNGEFQTGLDATYLLWSSVGLTKWVKPLKWKWLQPILKPCYRFFAKHRHTITRLCFSRHTKRDYH